MKQETFEIEAEYEGERLDKYLSVIFEQSKTSSNAPSRSFFQKLIRDSHVKVNDSIAKANYRLRMDDLVCVEIPDAVETPILPEDIPLDILYEDDDLLVVNKPKGMVVHPAPGNPDGTLVNALLYHCADTLSGIGGVIRPGIVHRIDKDTSGLLLIAKTDPAHIFLSEQFSSHKTGRLYETIVSGNIKDDCGTVDAPIGRHPSNRKKMAVISGGKEAVTHYRVIERYPPISGGQSYTRLSVRLETGRTHQIRVHMAYIGHPVLGDTVYGGDKSVIAKKYASVLRGQCLHARTIEFEHPVTHKLMSFDSGLPDYFYKLPFKIEM